MTILRMVGLLTALTLMGVAVVAIRVEQSMATRRIQILAAEHEKLRGEIWSQEMELAQLRSPQLVRERAERLDLDSRMTSTRADGASR